MIETKTIEEVKIDYSQIQYSKEELDLLVDIFKIDAPSKFEYKIRNFIFTYLDRYNVDVKMDKIGNVIVTKGTLDENEYYPCIVAHMDTVHDLQTNRYVKVIDNEKKGPILKSYVGTKQVGGCGDDGCGVWLALDMLNHLDKVKLVFCVEEEIGLNGSSALDLSIFDDCGYLIQGDRKGSSDIIVNQSWGSANSMCSEEFENILIGIGEDYGFTIGEGTVTDVVNLSERGVGISCTNLSCGYYNAHSNREYTVFKELINTRDYILSIIDYVGLNKSENHVIYEADSYHEIDYDTWVKSSHPDDCICTLDDLNQYSIDMECPVCNPLVNESAFCSNCGSDMETREHSLKCTVCNTIKIRL